MSLIARLSRHERSVAYNTWLDHIDTKWHRPESDKVVYTDFKFVAKSNKSVSITVVHTEALRSEQLSYRVYRQVYRALKQQDSTCVFTCLLFITKKANKIFGN